MRADIAVESLRDLVAGHHPQASWVGIGLAVVTLAAMPPLARAKRRVGMQLGSAATASESRQTMLCAYLSAALLVRLLANALPGWWWADPLTALAIAGVAAHEGHEAWRGDACSCCDTEHRDTHATGSAARIRHREAGSPQPALAKTTEGPA